MTPLLRYGLLLLLLVACASPPTQVAATDKADARKVADEAEAFRADAQRQIDQAEAAVRELERVTAEQQAKAAHERSARASRSRVTTPRARTAPTPPVVSGDVWGRLAACESGGNPRAVGGGGRFFGLYQFTLSTWRSVGGSGNPIDASPAEQTARAQALQGRSGWGQWPLCSRRLGLR